MLLMRLSCFVDMAGWYIIVHAGIQTGRGLGRHNRKRPHLKRLVSGRMELRCNSSCVRLAATADGAASSMSGVISVAPQPPKPRPAVMSRPGVS